MDSCQNIPHIAGASQNLVIYIYICSPPPPSPQCFQGVGGSWGGGVHIHIYIYMGVPKIRGTILGVPIIRTIVTIVF